MLAIIVVVQPNGWIPEAADTAPTKFISSYALMKNRFRELRLGSLGREAAEALPFDRGGAQLKADVRARILEMGRLDRSCRNSV